MILEVVNEALEGFDNSMATVIIVIDLSAAFDTIDILKMLEVLEKEIGVGGTALKWFESFLTGRSQRGEGRR